jgi:hypothetical protein
VKLTTWLHLEPKLICGDILHSPIRLHGVLLNKAQGFTFSYLWYIPLHYTKLISNVVTFLKTAHNRIKEACLIERGSHLNP